MILGDGPAVVVHDDDHAGAELGKVVKPLERKTTGNGAIADDGDDVVIGAHEVARLGHAASEAHGSGGMADGEQVVLGLGRTGETGQTAETLGIEVVRGATREHLVRIRLMGNVEDELVRRRIEHTVQGDGKLHDAEVRADVTPYRSRARKDGLANLRTKKRQVGGIEVLHVLRR